MRSINLVLLVSMLILVLLTVYLGASVAFCSGALKGNLSGCVIMAGNDIRGSVTAQIAALASGAGMLYWLIGRRRGR